MRTKPYSTQEAADFLELDRSRVLRFIQDGRLKATKIGNSYSITPSDLKHFAALERKTGWKKGTPRERHTGGRKRKDAQE